MKVFKYRAGTDRDISSLCDNYFYSPTREKLNDPYEGLFSRKLYESQLDQLKKILGVEEQAFDNVKDSFEKLLSFVDSAGIYSLSTDHVDELLWAHYADSHNGFCIEYELDELVTFNGAANYSIPVKYLNSPPHIELSDITDVKNSNEILLQKILATKSLRWEYEKELRVLTSLPGKHTYDYRAVKAIYFGMRMDPEKQKEIMGHLAGRGIRYYNIKMLDDYTLSHDEVDDPCTNEPKYLYSVSPVLEGALRPEYTKDEYKPYNDYLFKASEIIRRDPYCSAVEFVDFSPEKSTPENPVVLVMCPKCSDWHPRFYSYYPKRYLTLSEIDEQYSQIGDLGHE